MKITTLIIVVGLSIFGLIEVAYGEETEGKEEETVFGSESLDCNVTGACIESVESEE